MDIKAIPLVNPLRVYEARHVSRERGRKILRELEEGGEISPVKTSTGRVLLTFRDTEIVAAAL